MWFEQVNIDALKLMVRLSPSMYLVTLVNGQILWANDNFCEWSQYSLGELSRMTWKELSSNDADIDVISELTPYRLSYAIQKRYIPKNGKPQIGNLHVTRYPASGEIDFCWCRWEPLTNGTAQAFELAMESANKMTTHIQQLTSEVRAITAKTEEETFLLSLVRMTMKHPKVATAIFFGLLAFGGTDAVINTLQRLGFIAAPPVVVQDVQSVNKDVTHILDHVSQ